MMVYIYRESSVSESLPFGVDEVVKELSEMHSLQSAFLWMTDFAELLEKKGNVNKRISPQTKKILDYLNKHFAEQISLQNVADYIGFSGTHVSRLIKNDTGETFVSLLNKYVSERQYVC